MKKSLLLMLILCFPLIASTQCGLNYNNTIEKTGVIEIGYYKNCERCQKYPIFLIVRRPVGNRNDNQFEIFAHFANPGVVYGDVKLFQANGDILSIPITRPEELQKRWEEEENGVPYLTWYEGVFSSQRSIEELKRISKLEIIGIEINSIHFIISNWRGYWNANQCLFDTN